MGIEAPSSMPALPALDGAAVDLLAMHYALYGQMGWLYAVLVEYARFVWNCFLKPHPKHAPDQKTALESFYRGQAAVYDRTRTKLLKGREDMLGMVAAQIQWRVHSGGMARKPIWIDVGGGTGYNVEAMGRYLDIGSVFELIVIVDLSPSLTAVAADRVTRMGWTNVLVVCEDARHFRLEDHYPVDAQGVTMRQPELITLSYSLSMIPDFYAVVDTLAATLAPGGLIGVADFYVQNQSEYHNRKNTDGVLNRHCMWISRVFWRAWFEADRVNLEASRRDYLEYRFDTIASFNERCRLLGLRIPFYVWLGRPKRTSPAPSAKGSPLLAALDLQSHVDLEDSAIDLGDLTVPAKRSVRPRSWRLPYDYRLPKHTQFGSEYIYAFTWEDAQQDVEILNITEADSILAITSAGDNILAYACHGPKRIHAVDLNPNQNHLLELKLAAFTALGAADVWAMFGQGRHSRFREALVTQLSPHLSSRAFQYWLHHGPDAFREDGNGLYHTGGSRHALKLVQWIAHVFRLRVAIDQLCNAPTLDEQRRVWTHRLRGVLCSWWLSYLVLGNKSWLWRALGVPAAQVALIEGDAAPKDADAEGSSHAIHRAPAWMPGSAVWNYCIDTLDPVARQTHLRTSNHYYLLPLLGRYTRECHPAYLDAAAFDTLSQPGALDGLQIHTDELCRVLSALDPAALTIAVVMDSFDWFDRRAADQARDQVRALWRALAAGGRVLLRSAGVQPWYLALFRSEGFHVHPVAVRKDGNCIDRCVSPSS